MTKHSHKKRLASPMHKRALDILSPGSLLDLGAGNGQNTLIFQDRGFEVTLVEQDTSKISGDEYSPSQVIESNILNFEIPESSYDNIFCNFVLHFHEKDEITAILNKIKTGTRSGGFNYLSDLLALPPLFTEKSKGYWLKPGELKELYSDWDILHYEEATVGTYAGGYQTAAHIIARKPNDD